MAVAAETLAPPETASARMTRVAAIAAAHADAVDRAARFPAETFLALKAERLLGVMIPRHLGGEGASLAEVADLCAILAGACGASAMIYAMHMIKVSSFVSHGEASSWHRGFMGEIAGRQLLVASSTTEAGIGGDLRNSICAVETEGERFHLVKEASVISYARNADAILVTARRAPDAASSDQVMVAVRTGEYTLEQTGGWDTLGMRGTCSEGFRLTCRGDVAQIFPRPFSEIAAQSMLATSHILWSATWFGLAAGAVAKGQAYVKAAARKAAGNGVIGQTPPGALRLAEATAQLEQMKAAIKGHLKRYEAALADEAVLSSIGFSIEMNNLKIATSELAAEIIQQALMITGISGYRNDTPFSVGRALRDALSARIMISNDRILQNTSTLLVMSRFDTSLTD